MRQKKINAKSAPGGAGELKSQFIFLGIFIVAAAIVFVIFNWISHGNFLQGPNMSAILASMVYPTFMAWGLCFLFACNFNDLSWGSIIVLGSIAAGVFATLYGIIPGLVIGIAVGLILVLINFCIFAFTKIPSWIASICMVLIYEAISIALSTWPSTKNLVMTPLKFELGVIGRLPWSLIVLVVGFAAVYFIYNHMTIGFNIRAIGGNTAVARALGVNVTKTLMWVGLICGLIVGVAAFMQESYNMYTTGKSGLSSIYLVFQPMAAALLADIMQKRINVIIAVPICAFLIYSLTNLLTLLHVPSGTLQQAALCLFLIVFAVIGQRGVKEVVK